MDGVPQAQEAKQGQVRKAPESFLAPADLARVREEARAGRRDWLRSSFTAALAGLTTQARADDPAILSLPAHSKGLGKPVASSGYGVPSQYEANVQRRQSPGLTQTNEASVSFAPLQSLFGIVTPGGLHFERHHQGYWDVDPRQHRLMLNASTAGLMKTPLVFTLDELMRLPSVSRFHFLECGANTGMEWGNVAVPTVQYTHGMLSCSEFTGVPLRLLLERAGVDFQRARYVLAEGADGSSMTRTIPMSLVESGEVLVAYGQNGEMLRPENGYPLRLVVPGVQGVSWVKWLRRIEVGDQPWATKDETLHYVDLMPDGLHRQYSSLQECKSVITTPSGGQRLLATGYYAISGIAWSGRGKVRRVDVSVDGGRNWRTARLQAPVMDKCLTRFQLDWVWNGQPALLQSRAIDETGYVQPSLRQLRAVRGSRSIYHNNAIQTWQVAQNGEVSNVHLA
jgi:sulfane dehydrogenase subunit SoxC